MHRQREQFIYQRAYELAMSGFHISPVTVATALVQEGYPEASELLNSEVTRSDLRNVCARHWREATSIADPVVMLEAAEGCQPDQRKR